MASRATSQKIVDLLHADPGVASLNGSIACDGWKHRPGNGAKAPVTCIWCGEQFIPDVSYRQYCSRACWRADPKKHRSKEITQ